jgi:ABC-type oligopeptide transport system ATPase subunit
LNRPLEIDAASGGLRPKFAGAISFQDVTFTYAGTKIPALSGLSFSIPAGTMLGIVGKSGSGKSTIARLLQGINRDYSGFLKIDGADLREINLRHLRQSLGVVLQDNFLVPRLDPRQHHFRAAGADIAGRGQGRQARRRRRIHRAHAERLRDLCRGGLAEFVGRAEAADRDRPRLDQEHLKRYLGEFDFRYNYRMALGFNDAARAELAIKGIAGKRLTYRRIDGQPEQASPV